VVQRPALPSSIFGVGGLSALRPVRPQEPWRGKPLVPGGAKESLHPPQANARRARQEAKPDWILTWPRGNMPARGRLRRTADTH
jgi:hypothetical protein